MATIRMSEADVASDLHAVLLQVRKGVEIIIEQDHQAIAILMPSAGVGATTHPPGRKLRECIELTRAYEAKLGDAPTPDAAFAQDVQMGIDDRRDTLDPPAWD